MVSVSQFPAALQLCCILPTNSQRAGELTIEVQAFGRLRIHLKDLNAFFRSIRFSFPLLNKKMELLRAAEK